MHCNSDINYGTFTYYEIKEEARGVAHDCLSLIERIEDIYMNDCGKWETNLGQKLVM